MRKITGGFTEEVGHWVIAAGQTDPKRHTQMTANRFKVAGMKLTLDKDYFVIILKVSF